MTLRDRFPQYFEGHEPDPALSEVEDEPIGPMLRKAMLDGLAKFEGHTTRDEDQQ